MMRIAKKDSDSYNTTLIYMLACAMQFMYMYTDKKAPVCIVLKFL